MSTLPTSRPELSSALQRFFNIKGTLAPQMNDDISPVVNIADLWDSPALRYAIPVMRQGSSGAAAAKNSHVVWTPGAAVSLQVRQIIVHNEGGTALIGSVSLLTAADIVLLGATSGSLQMIDISANPAKSARPSKLSAYAVNATPGVNLLDFNIPANSLPFVWDIPAPGFCLNGNDENGIPGIAVVNRTQNEVIQAQLFGREWPLPGN